MRLVPERRFITKDGRQAIVRPVREEDMQGLAVSRREVIEARTGMTRDAHDHETTDEDSRRKMREYLDLFDKGAGCHIVALVEGEVAGSGIIRRQARQRTKHVGHIGIGIRPKFQGLGLGRAIMVGLIDWARSLNGAVTRVDLNVISDNARAIALYESLGFRHEGRRLNAVRYEDGRYADDLTLGMLLP